MNIGKNGKNPSTRLTFNLFGRPAFHGRGALTQGKPSLDHKDAGYEGGRIGGDSGEPIHLHFCDKI